MYYEVVISGAGIIGATLACLLGNAGKRVAVLEPAMPPEYSPDDAFDLRVSALSRASQQTLSEAGAWAGITERRNAPYETMRVWDATGNGAIVFRAADMGEPELGHIVENRVIQLALLDTLQQLPTVDLYCPARLQAFRRDNTEVCIELDNGDTLRTALLAGADGAHSQVREQAGIGWSREDYGQQGLVCVVRTALPHQQTAWQRFMPGGPLAFLPLSDPYHSSIVWTLPADRADTLRQQDDSSFRHGLAEALEQRLGHVEWVSQRRTFPLAGAQASTYVQRNIALLGDAAHTIHPLAGQGANLGIKDAAELARQLIYTKNKPGSLKVLRRYERARKGDNVLTQKSMEGFRLLFGNTSPPLRLMRNQGLNLVNGLPVIKNLLARQAMGI